MTSSLAASRAADRVQAGTDYTSTNSFPRQQEKARKKKGESFAYRSGPKGIVALRSRFLAAPRSVQVVLAVSAIQRC